MLTNFIKKIQTSNNLVKPKCRSRNKPYSTTFDSSYNCIKFHFHKISLISILIGYHVSNRPGYKRHSRRIPQSHLHMIKTHNGMIQGIIILQLISFIQRRLHNVLRAFVPLTEMGQCCLPTVRLYPSAG